MKHLRGDFAGSAELRRIGARANEVFCKCCHKDKKKELRRSRGSSASRMAVEPRFSRQNGFGPMLRTCELILPVPAAVSRMSFMTELMLRTVVPAVSIVRLAHGNVGFRGTVTSLVRRSRVYKVVPRLPREVGMVVVRVTRRRGGTKSLKFSKTEFLEAFRYFQATGHPLWAKTTLDQDNLDAWGQSDTGHLSDIVSIDDAEEENADEGADDDDVGPQPEVLADAQDRSEEWFGLEPQAESSVLRA